MSSPWTQYLANVGVDDKTREGLASRKEEERRRVGTALSVRHPEGRREVLDSITSQAKESITVELKLATYVTIIVPNNQI